MNRKTSTYEEEVKFLTVLENSEKVLTECTVHTVSGKLPVKTLSSPPVCRQHTLFPAIEATDRNSL